MIDVRPTRWGDVAGLAWWALRAKPVRAAASVLTLGVGGAVVSLALAVTLGFQQEVERLTFGVYARSLVISQNVMQQGRYGAPTLGDLAELRDEVPGVVSGAAWRMDRAEVRTAAGAFQAQIFGGLGDIAAETGSALAWGRGLSERELGSLDRFCVVGAGFAAEAFPEGPAEGARLTVNGISCEVVGVLAEPNGRVESQFTTGIVAPFNVAARYFAVAPMLAPNEASRLIVTFPGRRQMAEARIPVDRLLRTRHGAPQSAAPPFEYADPNAALRDMDAQRRLVMRLVMVTGALTVALAAIAFAALTAQTLAERKDGIALQLSMGARRGDVGRQLLFETALIGLAAGGVNALLSSSVAWAVHGLWGWPVVVSLPVLALTIFAGVSLAAMLAAPSVLRVAATPPTQAFSVGKA